MEKYAQKHESNRVETLYKLWESHKNNENGVFYVAQPIPTGFLDVVDEKDSSS